MAGLANKDYFSFIFLGLFKCNERKKPKIPVLKDWTQTLGPYCQS